MRQFVFVCLVLSGFASAHQDTPVTRVVNLLKEMSETLKKEGEEDKALYDKLACWCNNNAYDKETAIEANQAKLGELGEAIEADTALVKKLTTEIKELQDEIAANKASLAEATALRNKQLQEFHGMEMDNIQATENIRAALEVLGKHHEDKVVAENNAGEKLQSWSFLQKSPQPLNFLQPVGWSTAETATVQKALKSAASFMQATHRTEYYPSYAPQSGEIVGILKQMLEEMQGDHAAAVEEEKGRAALFAKLKASKEEEIQAGEKLEEEKEDQLADAKNRLVENKQNVEAEVAAMEEAQKFLKNMKKNCAEAEKNFNLRQKTRMEELTAVAETIEILTTDDARDAMSGTFSFLQTRDQRRHTAAKVLKAVAQKFHNPMMSALATNVELDAFTKVKKAIDEMIATLTKQQADEVEKNDWCKSSIHENEMETEKTNAEKNDLVTKENDLETAIKTLTSDIANAKKAIQQSFVNVQTASEERIAENKEFQRIIQDQTITEQVLNKALDRLANFYDNRALLQTGQKPPMAQKEYKPNSGGQGVMSMIEKIIYDTRDMTKESITGEQEANDAYAQLLKDEQAEQAALQKEVEVKSDALSKAKKDLLQTKADIQATVDELEGLAKVNADLHAECDYLLKNFDLRQQARAAEIEALKQAKQILSGAALS